MVRVGQTNRFLAPVRAFPTGWTAPNALVPAARIAIVVESISALQRLRREMSRFSQTGENYEHHKRVLDATIKELRKSVSRINA